ncbi:MAG: hypothetical protein KC468_20645, partial [Myxococcales bacterium]|nr:hypothetical protein [Myxococcales bacterium]
MLVSAGLNYGGLQVSSLLFNHERSRLLVTARPGAPPSSCVPASERVLNFLSATPSGDQSELVGRFGELMFGAACPPEPMEIALLDEPPDREETPQELERPEPVPERERPKPLPEKEKEEKEKPPEPEKEKEQPPEPEPTPEPEPEPEAEQQPEEKFDFVLEQLKMVEQLDQFDEEEAPEDVNYLSNINRDVAEETRAEITNLQQDAEEAKASQLEPTPSQDKGMADEDQVAELREQKAQLARQAPQERPSPEEQRPQQDDPKPNSLLALRDQAPRDHSEAMTRHDALASEADDGSLAPDRPEQASLEQREQQANTPTHDKKYKFRLSQKDLDALYGVDPQKKQDYIAQRQSKR